MGSVFMMRTYVNLHIHTLQTPEYFKEQDEYRPTYEYSKKYFSIDKRIDILQDKMQNLKEIYEIANSQLKYKHEVKLELIVLTILIAFFVIYIIWNMLIRDVIGFLRC